MWNPPNPDEREDQFECLVWHRGCWRHVSWQKEMRGWMFGYASAMCLDTPDRLYAPLPDSTPEHNFWESDYK